MSLTGHSRKKVSGNIHSMSTMKNYCTVFRYKISSPPKYRTQPWNPHFSHTNSCGGGYVPGIFASRLTREPSDGETVLSRPRQRPVLRSRSANSSRQLLWSQLINCFNSKIKGGRPYCREEWKTEKKPWIYENRVRCAERYVCWKCAIRTRQTVVGSRSVDDFFSFISHSRQVSFLLCFIILE